jgi:hypothetical protein
MTPNELSRNEMIIEMEKRRRKLSEKVKAKRPGKLYNATSTVGHFDSVIKLSDNMIEDILTGDYNKAHGNQNIIYRAFMEAVYGPTIWRWMELKLQEEKNSESYVKKI